MSDWTPSDELLKVLAQHDYVMVPRAHWEVLLNAPLMTPAVSALLNALVDLRNHSEVDPVVYWGLGTQAEAALAKENSGELHLHPSRENDGDL